ncbi:aromatic-amino-acid transaminase [Sphingopyxis panaciterrae]|uniref:amino acid aminotransferase n=1 Tax=Sphingopyxis panaciterrae TaxID=363841 RepID=UPI001423C085|nr:amino acid aminotransferase [Sphingopyxis panaciterrae]NIJ39507.1 aromatic-amino-acid transaminase [Sphingopyxis panaciterrae]
MSGLFAGLAPEAPDALLALIGLHAADPRPDKIDVGVGVYRDPAGRTPVFAAVKEAERRLVAQQASKSYLGPEGDAHFTDALATIALGAGLAASPRLVGLQTPGGTGALRLGAELLARAVPGRTIWVGAPTWANHEPLLAGTGLAVRRHRFFDPATSDIDFPAMMEDLDAAQPGDIALLHGCCHNPTGVSFSDAQWLALADFIAARGLLPFVDLAYQGLGAGLEADAAGFRILFDRVPEAVLAYSCDKNFGLYRDRVGALWTLAPSSGSADIVRSNLYALARINWSMPPDHGAAVVRTILDDAALREDWQAELAAMCGRIATLRQGLAASHPRLAPIGRQQGMFALLPLAPASVAALRDEHAIYMVGNGRINIAGLGEETIERFAAALDPFLAAGG